MSAAAGVGSAIANIWSAGINMEQSQLQRDLVREMWEKEKAYNAPKEQVKRLREAGLNPALAMNNGMLGNGNTTMPSAPDPIPVDFSPMAQGFRDSAALFQQKRVQDAQIENLNAQAENQRLKNITQLYRDIADLDNRLADTNLKGSEREKVIGERDTLYTTLETLSELNHANIDKIKSERRLNDAKFRYQDAQTEYQKILNSFAPSERVAVIRQLNAHSAELVAAAREHDAGALDKAADAALKGVNKSTAEALKPVLVEKARAESELEWFRAGNEAKRYVGGRIGSETPVVGSGYSYNRYNPRKHWNNDK